MNKDEFIKKEVTFERVLFFVGGLFLIALMVLYNFGVFSQKDDDLESEVIQEADSYTEDLFGSNIQEEEVNTPIFEEELLEPKEEEIVIDENKEVTSEFVKCLADSGMIIYGSATCPACVSLVEVLGGYEMVEPIYVECSENWDICEEEKETGYVPEVQIEGVLFEGGKTPENFSMETGCEL